MQTSELAIACTLSPAQLDERRHTVLAQLQREIQHREERSEGFAYRFGSTETIVERLASLIQLERQCCSFLRFALIAEPGNGSVWLEVSGPEGTKEFLTSLFADELSEASH